MVPQTNNSPPNQRSKGIILIVVVMLLSAQPLLSSCTPEPETRPPEYRVDVKGYSGKLLVSLLSDSNTSDNHSSNHVSVLVNNRGHDIMEDNDIRGFLDGNFMWGWNQPGQVHVRVGRKNKSPVYGEYELFRVTYRWEPLPLPENTNVLDATLKIFIEKHSKYPLTVYLYQINKDWNPGTGGILNNNVSPPKVGEMWWRDIGYKQQGWGLPGVNFASDTDPLSDTPEMPLAEAHYMPGDEVIEFSSSRLTDYINERVDIHSPLLFLLKLSDYQEDIPGARIAPYSGSTGDNRNTGKRPSLYVEWQAKNVVAEYLYDIDLEYGRDYTFPRIESPGHYLLAASFTESSNQLPPDIEYRIGKAGHTANWKKITIPAGVDADWVQFRIRAAHDAVILGNSFDAELSDTWILSAPPEEQHVPWHFISPSGKKYMVSADYKGDFNWSITFVPDELGPWKYYWLNEFSDGYKSDIGTFDVIMGDRENSVKQLKRFKERIATINLNDRNILKIYMHQFAKLERSAIGFLDPDTFNTEPGWEIRSLLNDIRGILADKPPDELPLKNNPPFKWQKRNGSQI